MNQIFDRCVTLLLIMAHAVGITYQGINVWIFVIIWPILTLVLLVLVIAQRRTIQRLRRGREGI